MTVDKNNDHTMDSLLVKYLLDEATTAERVLAEQWIHASRDQKKYFDELKQVWQKTSANIVSPSAEEAWQRFRQRAENRVPPRKVKLISLKRSAAAAAILLVLVVGGRILYQSLHTAPKLLTVASGDRTLTDTLADQSIITLNKNSKLFYPLQFGEKSRTVRLEGEAFFNVTEQKEKPFIVQVRELAVTVLGTSFNINEEGDSTEIIVASGSVKVTGKKNTIQLHAREKAVFFQKTGLLKKKPANNELYNYYRTQVFTCNNTSLPELVATLNRAYNSDIIIANPELNHLHITTTFHRSQPLDSILTILNQTFSQVSFSKEGNRIIIK